jgi:Uma2 family endonuclease
LREVLLGCVVLACPATVSRTPKVGPARERLLDDEVALYLESGVEVVWVVNPRFKTICVYRPGAAPELFSERQELTAEPRLPRFRVLVASLFGAEK